MFVIKQKWILKLRTLPLFVCHQTKMNSQIKGTPFICPQIKIFKLGALPLFNLKWKEFLNHRHSPWLFSVNTLNYSSTIMHIFLLSLRIQSHNAQSKKARLFTWIQWPRSFLIKENGLTIECHDQRKDIFERTTFCSFEKGKNDFSQKW